MRTTEAHLPSTGAVPDELLRRWSAATADRVFAIGICALYLWLAVGTAWTKLPWEDEGWLASPAVNLATTGHMGTTVLQSPTAVQRGLDRYTYWVPPLYLVTQAGWYEVFGFSLLTMRALSILWGLLGLGAWFAIARALSGSGRVALLAATFLAVDPTFLGRAAEGRMDVMCAALGASGIAAYLHLRTSRLTLAVVTGHTLVALSGLTHPAGALYFTALVVVMLSFDRTRLTLGTGLLACVPYLVGATAWGLYIAQSPAFFLIQFGGNTTGRFDGILDPAGAIKAELVERYLKTYGAGSHWAGPLAALRLLVLVAYALAIAIIAGTRTLRQQQGVRVLLWLTAMTVGAMTFFEGSKEFMYLVHSLPLFASLAAVSVASFSRRTMPRAALIGLGVTALVMVQLGGVVYGMARDRYHRDYLPAVSYLEREAEGRLVTGTAELGFHLGFHGTVRDDFTLGYPSGRPPSEIVVVNARYLDAWRRDPAIRTHVERLLNAEYRRLYDNGAYQIYARAE